LFGIKKDLIEKSGLDVENPIRLWYSRLNVSFDRQIKKPQNRLNSGFTALNVGSPFSVFDLLLCQQKLTNL